MNFFTPIQERILEVEARIRDQADGHHPDLEAALAHLLAAGGKRIRPAITLLTGEMLHADCDKLITLAAAIELLHTATLVHDDLIDGSLLRRGTPTLNSQWSPAATVLTGDFLFARAAKLASDTESVTVMRLFADTLATIVNGEIDQLFANRGLINREEYDQRIYAKTASMFELATSASAILSPAMGSVIDDARLFGYEIGMAFQIVDDVLDFTGEQTTVGKPVASDLRQGIVTLPALFFYESNPQNMDIRTILKGGVISETKMNCLVEAIRQSGAIERALEEAKDYIERGLKILQKFPASLERDALEGMALYIIDRRF